MKNSIKKVLGTICLFVIMINIQEIMVSAQTDFNIVDAKQELINKHSNNYKKMSTEVSQARAKEIDEKLLKLIAENKTKKEIDSAMSVYKVYRLDVPSSEVMSPLSVPSDAKCNAVSIYYDSAQNQWVVSGGGWWQNSNWFNDRNWMWFPYTGETHNVGGLDSVGIAYNNTSGTYNASVISSMGYMTDQSGWGEYSYSPSHGDGSLGVAFDFQDKQKYIKSPINPIIYASDVTYFGKGYSALIRYNSNFSSYNGNARAFYAHTWNSCNISGLTFGYGSGFTFGVNITFSDANGWKIFNNSDTPF
jgi:hypothetical protein